jgi:hypothetical protein
MGCLVGLSWSFVTQRLDLAAAESVDVLLQVVVRLIARPGTRLAVLPGSISSVLLCFYACFPGAVLLAASLSCSESLSPPRERERASGSASPHFCCSRADTMAGCCCDHTPHHPLTPRLAC